MIEILFTLKALKNLWIVIRWPYSYFTQINPNEIPIELRIGLNMRMIQHINNWKRQQGLHHVEDQNWVWL
jgi:hypothetical protein